MKITPEEFDKIIDYFVELNVLKETPGSGWRLSWIPEEMRDSVAEHVTLTAQIAYILARLEGVEKEDALLCVGEAVFHDNPESRLGDIDKLSARYLNVAEAFQEALKEQVSQLPKEIAEEILVFTMEANSREGQIATIVKDADILERALRAKIYASAERFRSVEEFFDPKEEEKLRTEGAKTLMKLLREKRGVGASWRKGLKKE